MILVGTLAEVTSVVRDRAGETVDPSTIAVDVYPPSAILTGDTPDAPTTYTYGDDDELTRVEEGVYRVAFTVGEPGAWRYRWQTTGNVQDVGSGDLWVTPTDFDTAPTTGTTPTVAEVAAILLDRRVDAFGKDQRTFTDHTRPSALDAEHAIARASRIVLARLGPALTATDVTADAAPLARDAIAHRAAMSLVMYLPEPEPEYERLRVEFDALMEAFDELLRGQTPKARGLVTMELVSPWSGDDEGWDILG